MNSKVRFVILVRRRSSSLRLGQRTSRSMRLSSVRLACIRPKDSRFLCSVVIESTSAGPMMAPSTLRTFRLGLYSRRGPMHSPWNRGEETQSSSRECEAGMTVFWEEAWVTSLNFLRFLHEEKRALTVSGRSSWACKEISSSKGQCLANADKSASALTTQVYCRLTFLILLYALTRFLAREMKNLPRVEGRKWLNLRRRCRKLCMCEMMYLLKQANCWSPVLPVFWMTVRSSHINCERVDRIRRRGVTRLGFCSRRVK